MSDRGPLVPSSRPDPPARLYSSKAVAAYLGRERTVRRWEKTEGLPVRRLQHGKSGSVFADTAELTLGRPGAQMIFIQRHRSAAQLRARRAAVSSYRRYEYERTGLNVVFFDPAPAGAAERLEALGADVVFFDWAVACPDPAIALWKARPQLLLVSVDLENDQVLVLSGQISTVLSADSLVELIETQTCLERRNP